ncbi:MAG: Zn-ribbon domain-containing OB-fold protein [Gammaproteobacteria bacterium]
MSLANGDSAEYFEAAQNGRLIFQKCSHCDAVQFPPRHHCTNCWEADLEWIDSTGKGKVETLTIVRRAPLQAYRDRVPYVVASVIVEEGPRMITNIVGEAAWEAQRGDAVTVAFEPSTEGDILPVFKRA